MGEADEHVVLRWTWRYQRLDVDEWDELDDAVRAARNTEDYGEGSLECIEVWDATGYRRVGHDEATAMADVWEAEERRRRAAAPKPPPPVAVIEVRSPKGDKWLVLDSYRDMSKAEREFAPLHEKLGERVRLHVPSP